MKKEPARVSRYCHSQSGRLYIYSQLKLGITPTGILAQGKLPQRSIWRYIKELKLMGCIEKVSYGVWKTIKEPATIGIDHSRMVVKSIRSHGFGFYLKIPKIYNWSNREEYLRKKNIIHKTIKFGSTKYQKFIYKNFHVSLFDKGIKFMAVKQTDSIYTNSATRGNELALFKIKEVIKGLETMFQVGLESEKRYCVKITRQHHALIKNELANLYNKDGKKLQVYTEQGLWLLIDFSLNMDELETVHKDTASQDMDNAIKPFFNSLKEAPFTAYDFKAAYDLMNNLLTNQKEYAQNIKLHLETLKKIQEALDRLGK